MKKRVLTRALQDPEWLDGLIALRLAVSLDEAQALVTRGAVHVNGRRVTATERVPVGAKLIVFRDARMVPDVPVPIVFRDAWLAVVDKPAGMASQAERADSQNALDAVVQHELGPQARMVHRLDKEASGLVLFAVHEHARAPLQEALERGDIHRHYVAIVDGLLEGEGTIKLRIGRHPTDRRLRAAFPFEASAGRAASSRYRVLARHDGKTAVELTLETGRTHQLRVHLAAIGHPLVGDVAYGGPGHARLCLHAHSLGLPHPRTHEAITLHSKLPPTFTELVPGLTSPFA
jgi:23S rRNA pseudouridine1911/1915/1917 synthase